MYNRYILFYIIVIFFFIILAVNIIIIINEVCVGSMRPKFLLSEIYKIL